MLLKDDKKGLVTIIMKKMKGGHNDMSPPILNKDSAEEYRSEERNEEKDYEMGYDSCCSDMIEAFKEGDSSKLKSSLKSFISMVLDEQDS